MGNLQSKGGSAFKSVPYAPKVVNKYVNAYLKQIDELEKKMKPSKRAVCGNLNGNILIISIDIFNWNWNLRLRKPSIQMDMLVNRFAKLTLTNL